MFELYCTLLHPQETEQVTNEGAVATESIACFSNRDIGLTLDCDLFMMVFVRFDASPGELEHEYKSFTDLAPSHS